MSLICCFFRCISTVLQIDMG